MTLIYKKKIMKHALCPKWKVMNVLRLAFRDLWSAKFRLSASGRLKMSNLTNKPIKKTKEHFPQNQNPHSLYLHLQIIFSYPQTTKLSKENSVSSEILLWSHEGGDEVDNHLWSMCDDYIQIYILHTQSALYTHSHTNLSHKPLTSLYNTQNPIKIYWDDAEKQNSS